MSWRRRLGALRARRDLESRLLWLLGSPRSGSTWLLQLLANHRAVVPINEPQIGWYLGQFLSDLPGVRPQDLGLPNFTLQRVDREKPHSFFSSEFRDVWSPALRRMMLERFGAQLLRYPASVPPSRTVVAIKEPSGSQSADLIMGALPRARFIFLLRDGRDVVDSDLAANLRGSWLSKEVPGMRGIDEDQRLDFVIQSAYKWLWRTEVVSGAFSAHPGPKRLLRYEDLLDDTAAQLESLFAWTGLDLDEERLGRWIDESSFEHVPPSARGRQAFHRAARPGMWRENLTATEQDAVEAILGPKLRELGYED